MSERPNRSLRLMGTSYSARKKYLIYIRCNTDRKSLAMRRPTQVRVISEESIKLSWEIKFCFKSQQTNKDKNKLEERKNNKSESLPLIPDSIPRVIYNSPASLELEAYISGREEANQLLTLTTTLPSPH